MLKQPVELLDINIGRYATLQNSKCLVEILGSQPNQREKKPGKLVDGNQYNRYKYGKWAGLLSH